jgi:hypothetical protein
VCDAERHRSAFNAECHHAECPYAECSYAECRYAECPYAECLYAECRGAIFIDVQSSFQDFLFQFVLNPSKMWP